MYDDLDRDGYLPTWTPGKNPMAEGMFVSGFRSAPHSSTRHDITMGNVGSHHYQLGAWCSCGEWKATYLALRDIWLHFGRHLLGKPDLPPWGMLR